MDSIDRSETRHTANRNSPCELQAMNIITIMNLNAHGEVLYTNIIGSSDPGDSCALEKQLLLALLLEMSP